MRLYSDAGLEETVFKRRSINKDGLRDGFMVSIAMGGLLFGTQGDTMLITALHSTSFYSN